MESSQTPDLVLLISPAGFSFNPDTAESNAFQSDIKVDQKLIDEAVQKEFDGVLQSFREHEIEFLVLTDTVMPPKPDAIFPNNWISFHDDGRIFLYPMMAPNRRPERRTDLVELLKEKFKYTDIVDLSSFEKENRFLEGTGSIVFDYINKKAYACRSQRTNSVVLQKLCALLDYKAVLFDAVDEEGKAIYHTNVLMALGKQVAIVCLDSIRSESDQEKVLAELSASNHKVIAISYAQMRSFAGNMLELKNKRGKTFIAMSSSAFASLLPGQLNEISKHAEPLVLDISTIEKFGGGSIRCMLAGIHLSKH